MRAVLLVHAGAGTWRHIDIKKIQEVLITSLTEGFASLKNGSALEAVVQATIALEDSGILNAGLGSVVDLAGKVSMDAGVMDGCTGMIGAVAAVTYPKNPVLLAKKVMELTDHVILAGPDADELARKLGLERHPGPTEHVMSRYKKLLEEARSGRTRFRKSFELAERLGFADTVGAVAVDKEGRVAAAVSTGGVIMKFPGRVGDSAVPGAGFYANKYAAAVATGIGETIIKSFLTLRAVQLVSSGFTAETASKLAIMNHTAMAGEGTAGVIVVGADGSFGADYNTEAMPWGYITSDEAKPAILGLPKK